MHEGLRAIYLGDTLKSAQQTFLDHYPTQLDSFDQAKTRGNGVLCLAEYVKKWKEEDKQWRVLRCERLDRQIDGNALILDLVVQHRVNEQILGWDHKVTGSYLNYKFWERFEPNSQITEYVKFIKDNYGYCDGFVINALALRFRQRAYKGEPAGLWFAFERQTFNRNAEQLQGAATDRAYWERQVNFARENNWWGMNTSSCWQCEYRDICKAGWTWPQEKELIAIQYREVCGTWSGEPLQPCALDRGHDMPHSPVMAPEGEFVVEVEA